MSGNYFQTESIVFIFSDPVVNSEFIKLRDSGKLGDHLSTLLTEDVKNRLSKNDTPVVKDSDQSNEILSIILEKISQLSVIPSDLTNSISHTSNVNSYEQPSVVFEKPSIGEPIDPSELVKAEIPKVSTKKTKKRKKGLSLDSLSAMAGKMGSNNE